MGVDIMSKRRRALVTRSVRASMVQRFVHGDMARQMAAIGAA